MAKEPLQFYTCSYCNDKIPIIRDGILRLCKCKITGVDLTKEYSRFVGVLPEEKKFAHK